MTADTQIKVVAFPNEPNAEANFFYTQNGRHITLKHGLKSVSNAQIPERSLTNEDVAFLNAELHVLYSELIA